MKYTRLLTESEEFTADSARWLTSRSVQVSSLCLYRITRAADLALFPQLARTVDTAVRFDRCVALSGEEIASFMEYCGNIKSLSFVNCILNSGNRVLAAVGTHCTSLRAIDLSCTQQSDFTAADLGVLTQGCKQLTEIKLNDCKYWVNNECIQIIGRNCPQLQSLEASNCDKCDDDALTVLAQHCPGLHHLNANHWSRVTDAGLLSLTACTELRSFCLNQNVHVTSQALVSLVYNCPKLKEVHLSQCDMHVDKVFVALALHCPAIRVVRCASRSITDRSLIALLDCQKLRVLEIKHKHPMNSALLELLDHCTTLQSLTLRGISQLPPKWEHLPAVAVAGLAMGLQSVSFSGNTTLRDDDFVPFIARCTAVTELNLQECFALTDVAVLAVAEYCPRLRRIDVSNLPITDAAVITLVKQCPHVNTIILSHCFKVTDAATTAIAEHCSQLEYFNANSFAITNAGHDCIKAAFPRVKYLG